MAAASLLSLKWNPLSQHLPTTENRFLHQKSLTVTTRFLRLSKPNATIKCSDLSNYKKKNNNNETLKTLAKNQNPLQGVLDAVLKTLKSLQKPAIAAVLLGFLLTFDPHSALAASGGRMGGRAFSSGPSSSRSYSVPSSPRFSYSAPYYAPSPFFGGGGFGFGVSVGAGSGLFLLMMGFAAAILVSGFLSDQSDDGGIFTATEKMSVLKLQVCWGFWVLGFEWIWIDGKD